MLSAFFDPPPDSGVMKSADAPVASASAPASAASSVSAKTRRRGLEWAGAKAAGILFMRRRSASPHVARQPERRGRRARIPAVPPSATAEAGRALLQERCDALA